ncbi:glycerophosphodiester phosphodiesterase [Salinigranum salinum]|uniref:glycerophosphodiester phosphodiesterase n=1 Tax=Salinigranum salinum TaxID=1364937 RepID=UPI0012604B82|nr:glycerophosphodiester phosphodiesterase [Salinigranum salinum]
MRLIGHRGCAARGPENTLAAIERAAPHVDAVEIDVRRCGSGELVVVHDAALDRLVGVDRRVSATPWSELRDLRVLDSDQRIPSLADVVEVLPPTTGLNVELKEGGLASDVDRAVSDHPDVWVSSFDPEALAETSLPRALLFADDWDGSVATAEALDCDAVHPHYDLVLDTPERVAAAHDTTFEVNVWTPPVAVVPTLRAAGVDGVIVDDWAVPW